MKNIGKRTVCFVIALVMICQLFVGFAANTALKIDLTSYPKTIEEGKSFGLRGKITSDCKITTVLGVIYDQNSRELYQTKDTPNAKSMDVKPANLNQKLPFGKLEAGVYKLTVVAKDENGGYVRFDKSFTVKGKNEDKTPDPKPEKSNLKISFTKYPSTIDEGESFGLRGNITSNYNITEVVGVITNSSGKKVMSTTDKPKSKSMDIRSADLNQDMSFGELKAGDYTMTVTAKDEGGGKDEFDFDFTVKGKTKTVTLSYDLNDGSGSCPDQSVEAGSKVKIEAKNPTREGYDFLGWSETGSDSADYEKGDKIAISKDTTLKAVWKKKEQPKNTDDAAVFKKTEEKVKEWFIVTEESTNKGTPLRSSPSDGDNITGYAKKNDTLYVVSEGENSAGNLWYKLDNGNYIYSKRVRQCKTLSVTYIAPDATKVLEKGKLTEGVATKISDQIPKNKDSNYTFEGWTTDKAAKTVMYKAGEKVTAFGNIGLYAVWAKLPDETNIERFNRTKTTVNKYYIVTEESTAQGTPLRNVPQSTATTLTGKYVKKNEAVYVSAKGQNNAGNIWYQLNNGLFIYSERVREAKSFKITYNANGGSGAPANQLSVTEGVKVNLSTASPKNTPDRTEYAFIGWSEVKNDTKATYTAGQQIIPTKDLELYAVWRKTDYSTYRAVVDKLIKTIDDSKVTICERQSYHLKINENGKYYKPKESGICNVNSMTTLLNRNLYFMGRTNQRLFTMIDTLKANGCKNIEGPIKDFIGNSYSPKRTGYLYTGQTIYFDKKTFTDSLGNTYKFEMLKPEDIKKNRGNLSNEEYLAKLLREHPEGVMLRSAAAGHTVVITDYEMVNNKIQFYVMDPVNVSHKKLEETHLYKNLTNHKLFTNLDYIAYIK